VSEKDYPTVGTGQTVHSTNRYFEEPNGKAEKRTGR
jgi:hypothetical protein